MATIKFEIPEYSIRGVKVCGGTLEGMFNCAFLHMQSNREMYCSLQEEPLKLYTEDDPDVFAQPHEDCVRLKKFVYTHDVYAIKKVKNAV